MLLRYIFCFFTVLISLKSKADLPFIPIQFYLQTEAGSYLEGDMVVFDLTIKNTSESQAYPVLIPMDRASERLLFSLKIFDKANNTLILRATDWEDHSEIKPQNHGVRIKFLKPQEEFKIEFYWNEASPNLSTGGRKFAVPLFAGEYRAAVIYSPFNFQLGDSIYTCLNEFGRLTEPELQSSKLEMYKEGLSSSYCSLKIRRTASDSVKIQGVTYYIDYKEALHWYYTDSIGAGGSNSRLSHATNLPSDSFYLNSGEYFYSYFPKIFAEYIKRFEDGDIMEYRRYQSHCPQEILTEKYDMEKNLIEKALILTDGRSYKVKFYPDGRKLEETYCNSNETSCEKTSFEYDKTGKLKGERKSQFEPCLESPDGKAYVKVELL